MISVLFVTLSVVSASNDTNIEEVDSTSVLGADTVSKSSKLTTKNVEDNVKTSASQTSKTASKISANSLTIKYNNKATLSAKITNANTGKSVDEGYVVFKVNGNTVGNVNVSNGLASLVYDASSLRPKTYTITAKYVGLESFTGSSAISTLTVLKDSSIITVSNATVIAHSTVKLTSKITDSRGNLVCDGKVAFKINGKTIALVNAANGIATYNYKASSLNVKTYKITASYGGNKLYESSRSGVSYLTVTQIPTRMTVNKVSGYSSTVQLKATVVDKISESYLFSGTIVFKINDKTVGIASITNGKASFTYNSRQLIRGSYKISAFLKPTSTYAATNATNTLTIIAQSYFTYSQIKEAAVNVRTQLEANNIVTSVYIGKSRISLSEFLPLMIQATKNIYNGKSSATVSYKHYATLSSQSDSLKSGTLTFSQMKTIGDKVLSYMNTYNIPPKYASTTLGNMGYYNIVYSYSKILDVSTTTYLPSTIKVYNWATIHPSNPKTRTIYITSDVIYNRNKDYAFMNSIKSVLESRGYTVKIWGYGPNSHCSSIWAESLPNNAVQLSIFSGTDAGVINDVCTRSFMRTKANRLMFFAYYSSTSIDITGLSFLKRAYDDNYSSYSFTGIAYPDIYLKNHGYGYVYTSSATTIANSLISYS